MNKRPEMSDPLRSPGKKSADRSVLLVTPERILGLNWGLVLERDAGLPCVLANGFEEALAAATPGAFSVLVTDNGALSQMGPEDFAELSHAAPSAKVLAILPVLSMAREYLDWDIDVFYRGQPLNRLDQLVLDMLSGKPVPRFVCDGGDRWIDCASQVWD
jgi:hypothetical protein